MALLHSPPLPLPSLSRGVNTYSEFGMRLLPACFYILAKHAQTLAEHSGRHFWETHSQRSINAQGLACHHLFDSEKSAELQQQEGYKHPSGNQNICLG